MSKFLSLGLLSLSLWLPAAGAAQQQQPQPQQRPQQQPQPQQPAGKPNPAQRPQPDQLERHLGAAETYQLSGDIARAAAENRAVVAVALGRLGALAIRERQLQRAARLLSDSLSLREDARVRTDLAIAHMRLMEIDRAVAEAQAAAASDERDARARHVLGKLLYMKGDYAGGRRELERAVVLGTDLDAAYTLGMTYLRLKELDRAKLLFEEMQTALGDSAVAHILFGRAYEETGFPAEAEREFKRALAIDPAAPRAHFYLGYVILMNGGGERVAEAAAEFERQLQKNPRDFYAHFFLGLIAAGESDHRKAVKHLAEAVRLKPESGESYLHLGQSQAELGDPAAEQSLRRAIVLTADVSQNSYQIKRAHFLLGRLLMKAGRKAEGEKELALARELQGQSLESSRQRIKEILGSVAKSAGGVSAPSQAAAAGEKKSDEADEAEVSVVEESPVESRDEQEVLLIEESAPDSRDAARYASLKLRLGEVLAQAYHNLGVIAAQQGRPAEGAAQFAAAAAWKPDLAGLDRNWGIVSFSAGQHEQAVQPLSRHLLKQPADTLARRMLGVSYYLTGNFKQAVETLRPLDAVITDDAELAYAYGVSLVRLADAKAATALFTRLAERHARAPQARLYAAQGFMMIADYDGALREYRAAARLDPALRQAHYNAGLSLIHLNRLDEAEQEFRQELALNPADEVSKYHLAYVLLESKQKTAEAVTLLKEAIAARPDYADARYRLGKALSEQGDVAGAIEHLEAAARAEPTKDYIRYQLSIAYRRAARPADAERELQLYKDLKASSRSREAPQPGAMGDKPNVP
ncbi:MAG TPA: tetratricopeptide repeat protein [Pyrinomonadaceae bacterium]